jgi:hypothetical protein
MKREHEKDDEARRTSSAKLALVLAFVLPLPAREES